MVKFRGREIQGFGYKLAIIIGVVLILGLVYFTFFSRLSRRDAPAYVYIDGDDTADSVITKVEISAGNKRVHGFRILTRYGNYGQHIHTGAYRLEPGTSAFMFFWNVRRGNQVPVKLVVPSVRSLDRFASAVAGQLMLDSAEVMDRLRDESVCRSLGCDTATVPAVIIPDTYELYWNTGADRLLERLKAESDLFWNVSRRGKAQALGLTPVEVSTLASIVGQETADEAEKPVIAGLYYNRLKADMPLQADPTVKFATKNFSARRIYKKDAMTESPYNTYLHTGLPPGPIGIPSKKDIDAVLDMTRHNYLYMCAKEDFSGTHNFAETYREHMENARRYARALDERGIK